MAFQRCLMALSCQCLARWTRLEMKGQEKTESPALRGQSDAGERSAQRSSPAFLLNLSLGLFFAQQGFIPGSRLTLGQRAANHGWLCEEERIIAAFSGCDLAGTWECEIRKGWKGLRCGELLPETAQLRVGQVTVPPQFGTALTLLHLTPLLSDSLCTSFFSSGAGARAGALLNW